MNLYFNYGIIKPRSQFIYNKTKQKLNKIKKKGPKDNYLLSSGKYIKR